MLKIENITKKYSKKGEIVLDNFSLILDNEKIGLYGANGLGKSTLLNVIAGFVTQDKGEITIDGYTIKDKQYRNLLGMVLEEPLHIEELTVSEMLDFWGGMFRCSSEKQKQVREELIDFFELAKYSNSRIKSLSKGFKSRLSLAIAIYMEPKYLILDEPFDGIDEVMQEKIMIFLKESNYSFIISMHDKNKLEMICDKVITID